MKRILIVAALLVIATPCIYKLHTVCLQNGIENAERIAAEAKQKGEAEYRMEVLAEEMRHAEMHR